MLPLSPPDDGLTPAERDIKRGRQHFVTESTIREQLPARLHPRHARLWAELGNIQQGFIHVYGDMDVSLRNTLLNVSRTANEQLLNRDDVDTYLYLVNKPNRYRSASQPQAEETPANQISAATQAVRPRQLADVKRDYDAAWGELKEALVPQGIPALLNLTGVNSPAPWLHLPREAFAENMQQIHQKTEDLKRPVTSHLARIEWLHAEYTDMKARSACIKR